MASDSSNAPAKTGFGLNIKVRIFALVGFFILSIVASGLIVSTSLTEVSREVENQQASIAAQNEQIANQSTLLANQLVIEQRVNAVNETIKQINEMLYWEYQASLTFIPDALASAENMRKTVAGQLAAIKDLDPSQTEAIDELLERFKTYEKYAARMYMFFEKNSTSMGKSMGDGVREESQYIAEELNKILALYSSQIEESRAGLKSAGAEVQAKADVVQDGSNKINDAVGRVNISIAVASGIASVIGLLAGLLFLRSILNPISGLVKSILHIEQNNDLSHPIIYDRGDELSAIVVAFNSMLDKFARLIGTVRQSVEELHEVVNASAKAASGSKDFVERQKTETDLVATASTEMSATAKGINDNTDNAVELVEKADRTSVEGQQVVSDSVVSIQQLSDQISAANEVINDLAKRSESIGGVLDVIRGISEQTNLLALNAAIEAARAGEQGRGFAVVADEVRNLAQRTNESTVEIQEMVENLQQDASKAVTGIQDSLNKSNQSVEQIERTRVALQEITEMMDAIGTLNRQISEASAEQNSVAHSIDESINKLSEMVGEVKQSAENTSLRSESLAGLSQELKGMVDEFHV